MHRQVFSSGVLEDDLLDNTIYMSVLDEGYAARVASLHHYLAISRDVMNRSVQIYLQHAVSCTSHLC